MDKPSIRADQIHLAADAIRHFEEIRKRAKKCPQFISENNAIDTVVLDYQTYEEMFMKVQALEEIAWELHVASRLQQADSTTVRYSLEEVLGKDRLEQFKKIDPNTISDEELFN